MQELHSSEIHSFARLIRYVSNNKTWSVCSSAHRISVPIDIMRSYAYRCRSAYIYQMLPPLLHTSFRRSLCVADEYQWQRKGIGEAGFIMVSNGSVGASTNGGLRRSASFDVAPHNDDVLLIDSWMGKGISGIAAPAGKVKIAFRDCDCCFSCCCYFCATKPFLLSSLEARQRPRRVTLLLNAVRSLH